MIFIKKNLTSLKYKKKYKFMKKKIFNQLIN